MINKLAAMSVKVLDLDEALDFYVNKLGLEVGKDVKQGTYRWLTVRVPGDPSTEIHLDQPDEARVLSGALERGLGRVLVAEGELGLGEQRQGLGGLTPAIVDRSWIRAGRCSAKEVLGERRGLLSAITGVRVVVFLVGDLSDLAQHSGDPHRRAPTLGRHGAPRVGQSLLVPLSRLRAITGGMMAKGSDAFQAQQQAYGALEGAVLRQTYLLTYMDAFRVVGIFFLLCIPMLLLFKRRAGRAAPPVSMH